MALPQSGRENTALVVAHPGHELRVHGLLCRWRPVVSILTDGSGRTGRSRIPASRQVIEQAGASPGDVFGRFSDRELYAKLLSPDVAPFVEIAEQLADSFVREKIVRVLGDASEGYNPAHEVCRLVIDAAIARACTISGVSIENWSFSLAGPPKPMGPAGLQSLRVPLTSQEFATKIETAGGYEGLDEEVRRALSDNGAEAFRTEWIWQVRPTRELEHPGGEMPHYERFGQARVQSGFYREVIRSETHIRPLAEALLELSVTAK